MKNKITLQRAIESKNKGVASEQLACDYLLARGLQLIERNFSCRYGEIDLVMKDDDTIVFIEVRYRKNRNFGGASASVTPAKQRRIIKTALSYLQQNMSESNMRFDVVGIEGNQAKIEWIQAAFLGF
jgi:putative endonuclease